MLDRYSGLPLHRFFYVVALVLIAIGVSLNKVVMSVGTIMLISSWVLEGDFKEKWNLIKQNRSLHFALSYFVLHIVGLLWTNDFVYATQDLRSKLPILVIPFVLGSIPAISKFEFRTIVFFFILTVVITTGLNFMLVKGIIPTTKKIYNFRDYSFFISHIRLSLMVDFSIFILLYACFNYRKIIPYLIPFLLWLLYYVYFSQIISGLIYLILLIFASALFVSIQSKNNLFKYSTVCLALVSAFSILFWINKNVNEYYSNPKEMPKDRLEKTVNGNPYRHDPNSLDREQGNLIYYHICDIELNQEWAKRSSFSLDSKLPDSGAELRIALIRYMSAKGLTKDSLGVSKLSLQDISNVEKGYTSPLQAKGGLKFRIYSLLNDYEQWKTNPDPNNKTLFQRLSYWEAAWSIFMANPLIGVGTGDIQNAFDTYYIENDSKLKKENRLRSHNQYLSTAVSFGIFGLLIFLVFLFYPIVIEFRNIHYLNLIFILLMMMSFLPEDTLETQSGVSFFALFYSLFLFKKKD